MSVYLFEINKKSCVLPNIKFQPVRTSIYRDDSYTYIEMDYIHINMIGTQVIRDVEPTILVEITRWIHHPAPRISVSASDE